MILNLLLIFLCIILSAFFSGSEIAYSSASEKRLRHAAEKKGDGYRLACRIKDKFDKALIAILVGNNLVNIGASSLATLIAVGLMGESGAWVATGVMTLLIITFGEISPKILASSRPEGFAKAVSTPLAVWMTVLYPLIWVLQKLLKLISRIWEKRQDNGPAITDDDMETVIETVEDEGVVDGDTAELLQSALDFGDVLAYEVITPRVDLVAIDKEDSREEMLKTAFSSHYTRIPVYEDTLDNIVGILHLNHLYKALVADPDTDIMSILLKPLFVHKTMPLDDVFKTMRKNQSHMVIVTDEYGAPWACLPWRMF